MRPGPPSTDLIVIHAQLLLGFLEGLLDFVPLALIPGKGFYGNIARRVAQRVFIIRILFIVSSATHEQVPGIGFRLHLIPDPDSSMKDPCQLKAMRAGAQFDGLPLSLWLSADPIPDADWLGKTL